MVNFIVVGAGLAGSVVAEHIARVLKKNVLIIEQRHHIGGNTYDYYNDDGILIHSYGPHIFHTNNNQVWDYLSQFNKWYIYNHRVLGYIDSQMVPLPFNLNTLYMIFTQQKAEEIENSLIKTYNIGEQVSILELKKQKDQNLKLLGEYVFDNIYVNYTMKQWGKKPEELDPSVLRRVPVRISKDNRYFKDRFQGTPEGGYTKLVNSLLHDKHIKVLLNTNCKEVLHVDLKKSKTFLFGSEYSGKLIYTGKIDEFFDYRFGELPYRSLDFRFKTLNEEYAQEAGSVNYPNDYAFTRINEYKHLTGQTHPRTTITEEYPKAYKPNSKDIPYYPILTKENLQLYEKYKKEAKKLENLYLLGRLAEYKYYNMDAVVEAAMKLFNERLMNG